MIDIEKALTQELHDVAGGLDVPPMPALPQEPPHARRHWMPVLAAAAVLLIVLGVVALVSVNRGGRDPDPAPPTPEPTKVTEAPVEVLPRTAPTIPYTVDEKLYVDGEQVPGRWWYLQTAGPSWLAMSAVDNTWWWGRGPEPRGIDTLIESAPVLSPDGLYVAMIDAENGVVTGFDTTFSGEGLMSAPVDLDDPGLYVRAVTTDAKVIVQGLGNAMLWLPFEDNGTVDLTETAPGKEILANTPAGLVVSDGVDGEQYLAEISAAGELTRLGDLPANDTIEISPGGEWMTWTPPGTFGGEVESVGSLEFGTVGGDTRETFEAPDGWTFEVLAWAWETDDHLVSPVLPNGGEGAARMVRCSVLDGDCVLIR